MSDVQHDDSVISQIIFHYKLFQENGYNSLCYTYKWDRIVFVFVWLISLSIIPFMWIYIVANGRISFFMAELKFPFYLFIFLFWPCQVACGILVPWSGIEPRLPALEAWHLNHWTTREVLSYYFKRCHCYTSPTTLTNAFLSVCSY